MSLKEIIEKCKTFDIIQTRCIEDKYVEIVISNQQIDGWNKVFFEIFGPAIKPAGKKPTKEALLLTKEYGGIQYGQILFKQEIDGNTMIAMLWPWQDGMRTTLKMAVLK